MSTLLVCNSYSPHVSPRSIRWSAITEQWARRGDGVHVVCGWSPGTPRFEVLNGVHVHRVGGGLSERLRNRLGGDGTTPAKGNAASPSTGIKSKLRFTVKRGFRFLHDAVWKNIYWPDYACLWARAATREMRNLIKQHNFDRFVTTSLPFSDHLVGLRTIGTNPELPWLVDVGDPFSFLDDTPTNNHFLYRRRNRRVERRVFELGDAISVTNENTRSIYADLFPESAHRVNVIPPLLRDDVAGTDTSTQVFAPSDRLRVSFIGTLHPKIRTPQFVLAFFHELRKSEAGRRLELHFFGPANHCEPFFEPFREQVGSSLFIHGPVPHATARRVMSETDVLLNIGNSTTYQLPSKIVEYASTGKPILNVTTVDGDSSEHCLKSYPQAVSVRLADHDDITAEKIRSVAQFLQNANTLARPIVDQWCRPYQIDSIVSQYDTLFAAADENHRRRYGGMEKQSPEKLCRPGTTLRLKSHSDKPHSSPLDRKPQVISITGSTGFIGGKLVESLSRHDDIELRLLTRQGAKSSESRDTATVLQGDLLNPESLTELPVAGGTVINTVYLAGRSCEENVQAAANLAEASAVAGIKRLIHCSTAVVVGRPGVSRIDESTPCRPRNDYEQTKLAVEEELQRRAAGRFELAILRPTAVFGPGGQNLLKLANDLQHGRRFVNYWKSCLFNRRRMNTVCVGNVVAALEFLAAIESPLRGDVFLISDDDQPGNNYRDIEQRLLKQLGRRDYQFPRIPIPQIALKTCLRIAGKSSVDPNCEFTPDKIVSAGLQKPVKLHEGLEEFAEWYRAA